MGLRPEPWTDPKRTVVESGRKIPQYENPSFDVFTGNLCRFLLQCGRQPRPTRAATTETFWYTRTETSAESAEVSLEDLYSLSRTVYLPAIGRADRLAEKMDQLMDKIERLVNVMEQAILQGTAIPDKTRVQITPSIEALADAYDREKVVLSMEEFEGIYDESVLAAMGSEEELP